MNATTVGLNLSRRWDERTSPPYPQGATVNEASITNADATVGSLTVHTIDEVLFPPWSAPAKVLTPQQVLAFEGWAPEVINGRLAMLGFLTCVVQAGSLVQSLSRFRSTSGVQSNHIRGFARLKCAGFWWMIGDDPGAQEVATGHSFTQQLGDNFGIFAAQVQLWAFASLAPSFSSNEAWASASTHVHT